jgi:molybdopterin-containing oxidoreductase family iron-sulfur binding subunit
MGMDRRRFLKVAGVGALGLAGMPATRLFGRQAPSAAAGGGKRLAMVIDLSKDVSPTADTAGIQECHRIHNVPTISEKRHEIKWIWTTEFKHAFPTQVEQEDENNFLAPRYKKAHSVPVLCNHCENPACVRVCPTQATYKRKEDGIVLMDFHRCIGCRFCMAACPYGARSFNFVDPRKALDVNSDGKLAVGEVYSGFPTRMKGVVEKCNFCAERLAVGEQPACVEQSTDGRMVFGDLADKDSEVRKLLRTRYTIRRKPSLGTMPNVYYIV